MKPVSITIHNERFEALDTGTAKGRALFEKVFNAELLSIFEAYEKPSREKEASYLKWVKFVYDFLPMEASRIDCGVVSANKFQFTFGAVYWDEMHKKDVVLYITKEHNYIIEKKEGL